MMAHIRLLVRNVRLEPNSTPRPLGFLDPNFKENTTETIIYMRNKIPETHFFGVIFLKKSWGKDFTSLFFPRAFVRIRTREKSYWGRPSKSSLHVFCEAYPGARTANILLENYLGKKKSSSKNFTSQVFLGVFVWQFLGLKGIKQGNFWKILAGQTFNMTILTCFFVNTYVRKNPGAETPTNYFLQNHLVRKIGGKHFIFVPRLFLVGNSGGGLQNHICGVLVRKSLGRNSLFFWGGGNA